MTLKEMLELNIKALQAVRVPLSEPEIYQAISNTINDLRACVEAIARGEEAERAAAEQTAAEGAEAHE